MIYDFYLIDIRIYLVDCDYVEYCLYFGFINYEIYLIIYVDI